MDHSTCQPRESCLPDIPLAVGVVRCRTESSAPAMGASSRRLTVSRKSFRPSKLCKPLSSTALCQEGWWGTRTFCEWIIRSPKEKKLAGQSTVPRARRRCIFLLFWRNGERRWPPVHLPAQLVGEPPVPPHREKRVSFGRPTRGEDASERPSESAAFGSRIYGVSSSAVGRTERNAREKTFSRCTKVKKKHDDTMSATWLILPVLVLSIWSLSHAYY